MKKVSSKIIVFLIIINIFLLSIYFNGKINMFYSPYHNFPIIWNDVSDKEAFLDSYINKLKQYDLFEKAYKLDSNMIDKSLKSILLNNEYIDLKKISDYSSITKVGFYNNENYEGETFGYKTIFFNDIYKIDVKIYEDSPTVYYHELLHALFPWKEDKYNFLSEAIVSIMVDESYKIDNNLYYNEKIMMKMWIELLGVNTFKQVLVNGNVDSFKNSLLEYNVSSAKIDEILNNMDLYHQLLLKEKQLDNIYLEKCLNDINDIYRYLNSNNLEENKILDAYMKEIYKENDNLYYVYLDSDNYKYFINYPNTTFYNYSDGVNIFKVNLEK